MTGTKLGRRGFVVGAGLLASAPGAVLAAPSKPRVLIRTNHGSILVELEAQKAPITAANFLRYVDAHAYDGGSFYRAARDGTPGGGTIVGAPNPNTHPFPPIHHESTTKTGLRHVAGAISIGRFDPGTATSNFFICASDEPYLDAHPGEPGDNLGYAVFGQTLEGLDVVRKILTLPANGKTQYAEQRGEWLKPPAPILGMRRV
ncbi:MAG: peptidylprolyl isomerase [Caulobacteraceae bacterium]|nr:peptidylprolyl isomerase [Caulobacteraceae bacterium]